MNRLSPRQRSPLVNVGLVVGVMCVVVFGAASALALLRLRGVADDLRMAQALLERASDAIEDGRVDDGQGLLDEAAVRVTEANSDLYGRPEFDLIGWMPIVERNLSSLRSSLGTALTLVQGGRSIIDAGRPLVGADGRLAVPLSQGSLPIEAIDEVSRQLEQVAAAVAVDPGGDDSMLFSEVKELEDRVEAEAARRQEQLGVLGRALRIAVDLSGGNGQRRYLIAVANTAEMRGSGGMVLNYGEMLGRNGDFELGEFGRIDELLLSEPVPAEETGLPMDYLRRWSGFDPLLRWRNATLSPDFTLTAPVLAAMYEQATGERADGVIQIDPAGLAAILRGTGPVVVPELGAVDASNVVDLTLNEAYIRFPDIDDRSDVLTEVAEAAFERLVEGEYQSLRPLADALVRSAQSRHILAWSRSDRVQSLFSSFDIDGALPPPEDFAFAFTLQNLSANKLDYYVDSAVALTDGRPDGEFEATVTVTNTVSPQMTEPRYIVGPFNESQTTGRYRGAVSLYVPVGTELLASESIGVVLGAPVVQSEDGRTVVAFTVEADPESAVSVALRLRLPPGTGAASTAVQFVASQRVRPTEVAVDLDLGDAVFNGLATLDRALEFASTES